LRYDGFSAVLDAGRSRESLSGYHNPAAVLVHPRKHLQEVLGIGMFFSHLCDYDELLDCRQRDAAMGADRAATRVGAVR
jgi:hypothetical protein